MARYRLTVIEECNAASREEAIEAFEDGQYVDNIQYEIVEVPDPWDTSTPTPIPGEHDPAELARSSETGSHHFVLGEDY